MIADHAMACAGCSIGPRIVRESTLVTRRAIVVLFVLAELWQLFFGGFSSIQLGAPGVGDRAAWVPSIMMGQAITLLPLGFIGCLWGAPAGRLLGAACGIASLALAVVAVVTLSSAESSFIYGLPFLAVPGVMLLAVAWKGTVAPVSTVRGDAGTSGSGGR